MRKAAKNPVSPKKLLLTKWTAVQPQNREKHFLVTELVEPVPPATDPTDVILQAVHSGRTQVLHWRALADAETWRQGWV